MPRPRPICAIFSILIVAGCDVAPAVVEGDESASVDAGRTFADPALRAALADPIVVDPMLVQQANADAVRPPTQPVDGAVPPDPAASVVAERIRVPSAPPVVGSCPRCRTAVAALTLGALAEAQGGRAARCATRLSYSAAWADRFPAALPLYPDAEIRQAAGAADNGCALRIVGFHSAAPPARLIDWYAMRMRSAAGRVRHHQVGAAHVLVADTPASAIFSIFREGPAGVTEGAVLLDGND